nr:cadherin [Hymenolepis microstoma]
MCALGQLGACVCSPTATTITTAVTAAAAATAFTTLPKSSSPHTRLFLCANFSVIILLIPSFLSSILASYCSCKTSLNLTATCGTPFLYTLPANFTILSSLPSWLMIIQSKDDHSFSLIGLPFLLDGVQGSSSVLIRNSQSECISMHISVTRLPEEPPTFSCRQNHSIIAAIQIGLRENSSDLQSPSERINIWHNLNTQMVGANLPDSHLNLELDQAFLVETKPNFLSSLFVLAQANSENRKSLTPNEESIKSLFFIWKIGCSYLDDSALQVLSKVEKKFKGNPSIVEWLGPAGSVEEAKLLDWMVGEYKPVLKSRTKRRALQGYQPIYPSRTAGAVSEASGLSPTDIRQPKYPTSNPNAAILVQPVLPIEITVQQITNFQIPPNTFRSPDGSRLQLRLFEHIYPMQFGIDFKDPSAATGREIISDSSSWISFDSATEILRLRPFLEHEGTHKFVLCAYNMLNSRTCTNINVRVKPPMPIKKSFAVNVAPGIYWCYTIPLYWFDELKVHSIADVEFYVTGEGFSWDAAKGEICIVTTLQREEIKVFFFRAVHRVTSETVEIELRIAVKVPPTEKIISSPRFRIRLRWMHTYNNYEMLEIARLNLSLTQALRVRVNPSVISKNLFIYDVLQIRNFQEKDSSPLSKLLEIEFIYLPLNIPNPGSANYLNILNDHSSSSNYWVSGVPYGLTAENKQLYQLKGLCENARLSGAVSAIQAAAESFRPFLLESVAEVDLPDGACSKILQMFGGNMDSNRIYPPPLTTTNIPYSDQVIENFTVEAGLAFRKRINPSRVVPMNRIRSLEIIDESYNRLNDTAWITVAEDKTNLFGLPLQNHARKDAYRFWLSILTVDQRTPLNIHFTVDVVKWPLEMTTARGRFGWYPQPIAILNHRVRMRMKLGGTVGRGISPTYNWPPTSPETSLSYRWNLVTNLDKYLRSECGPHCGVGIMLVGIQRQDQSIIQVEWALLPVLQEGLRDGLMNSSYVGTQAPACPQRSIQELQRKLLKVPLYNRFSSLSSSVPNPHQEYFAETELRQASWSAPAPQLVEHLDWARIGTVTVIAVDLIGSCFSPYWKGDVTAKQSDFLAVLNITTYIGETFRYPITSDSKCFQSPSPTARLYDKDHMEVNETSWLGLDAGKCAIFGVVMKAIVTSGLHEFRIMLSPTSPLLSRVIIRIGERNPRLPEVPNHRVLMRFEPGFAVRADPRTHILQTLIRKWQFLVTLDDYLRPECQKAGRYVCSSDMDILIISIAPDDDILNVIWAKKSLVYNSRVLSSGSYNNNKFKIRSRRALNYGDIPVPRLSDPQLSCPWNELEKLTLQLQTSVLESRIQPDLQRRFQQAGFGRLIDVKVERLGNCAEQSKPFITDDILNVIWAKKSLVYNSRVLSSGSYNNNKFKIRSRRALNYGDIPVPRLSDPQLSCPWNELEKLTLQLQTSVLESRIQPDLQRRFQQAGFGRLIDVKVERLGNCAEQSKPFITGKRLD